jgi:hypothetical protein
MAAGGPDLADQLTVSLHIGTTQAESGEPGSA